MRLRTQIRLIAAVAVAILATSCGDDSSPTTSSFESDLLDPDRRGQSQEIILAPEYEGDTVVWLHDQEPVSLHPDAPANGGTQTADWVSQGLLHGLFGLDSSLTRYPELLAETPVPAKQDSGEVAIEFDLRPNLNWSDGEKITADDVLFTFETIIEGCGGPEKKRDDDGTILDGTNDGCFYSMGSRRGYSLIKSVEVLSATKFVVNFASVYPDWQSLFPYIFARHAFGENALEVNKSLEDFRNGETTLPSSGPLVFDSWKNGQYLRLRPNENSNSITRPDAASQDGDKPSVFEVRFLPNLASVQQSMLQGRGHFVLTDVSSTFLPISERDDITVAANGGFLWEHVGMNLSNNHLEFNVVREAVAAAIDKEALVASLYAPLFGSALPSNGLGNSFWMPQQAAYTNHQEQYSSQDLDLVEQKMSEAGYFRNGEGLWEHPEDGIAEFRTVTIANDSFRAAQQEIINDQLKAAGFGATSLNLVGSEFYTTTQSGTGPFASKETWDLAIFAWSGGTWPGGQSATYGGKASANNINNIYGFSSEDYDKSAKACGVEILIADQQSCYNELDLFATTVVGETGLFIVPLSQKPPYFAFRNDKVAPGVVVGDSDAGPFVNAADFALK